MSVSESCPALAAAGPFACQQCGACCRWPGYVYLTATDVTALSRRAGVTERTWIERHAELGPNRAQLVLRPGPAGACRFLKSRVCRIYADRPVQCRSFPAWRRR